MGLSTLGNGKMIRDTVNSPIIFILGPMGLLTRELLKTISSTGRVISIHLKELNFGVSLLTA
jgi:hypothetical protein